MQNTFGDGGIDNNSEPEYDLEESANITGLVGWCVTRIINGNDGFTREKAEAYFAEELVEAAKARTRLFIDSLGNPTKLSEDQINAQVDMNWPNFIAEAIVESEAEDVTTFTNILNKFEAECFLMENGITPDNKSIALSSAYRSILNVITDYLDTDLEQIPEELIIKIAETAYENDDMMTGLNFKSNFNNILKQMIEEAQNYQPDVPRP